MIWRSGLDENGTVSADGPDQELAALRSRIDLAGLPPLTLAVIERVIRSTAEISYANDLVCSEPWLEDAVGALAAGAPIVADGPMVTAGIAGDATICKAGESLTERLSRTAGIAKAAAAVRLAFGEAGPGAIWVVGDEPVAIHEILARDVQPTLVIGMPGRFRCRRGGKADVARERCARSDQHGGEGRPGSRGRRLRRVAGRRVASWPGRRRVRRAGPCTAPARASDPRGGANSGALAGVLPRVGY